MLISSGERNHYVAVKSLSRLLASENTNHQGKQYFCMNCLQGFEREISRDEHIWIIVKITNPSKSKCLTKIRR